MFGCIKITSVSSDNPQTKPALRQYSHMLCPTISLVFPTGLKYTWSGKKQNGPALTLSLHIPEIQATNPPLHLPMCKE